MKMRLISFVKQSVFEGKKVSWPSLKESSMGSFLVLVAVCVSSLFFLFIDNLSYKFVSFILGVEK